MKGIWLSRIIFFPSKKKALPLYIQKMGEQTTKRISACTAHVIAETLRITRFMTVVKKLDHVS